MMYILERLKEPSTYAGLAATVAVFRPELGGLLAGASEVLACIFGGIAVLVAERRAR
jgi:hypothetical protein